MTVYAVRSPAPVRVVWDGQSQLRTPVASPDLYIPARVMFGTGVPWHNASVAGTGWEHGTGASDPGLDADADTRLFPQARNRSGCDDVLVLSGGQHDAIWAVTDELTDPGLVAYDALVTYADAARAAGFTYVIATTMPAIASVPVQAAFDQHNAALLADESNFDATVDIAVGDLDDAGSAYFIGGGIHLSAAGAQAAADLISPVLAPFLTP